MRLLASASLAPRTEAAVAGNLMRGEEMLTAQAHPPKQRDELNG